MLHENYKNIITFPIVCMLFQGDCNIYHLKNLRSVTKKRLIFFFHFSQQQSFFTYSGYVIISVTYHMERGRGFF